MRVGEGEAQVGQRAVIGGGRHIEIGVLALEDGVARPGVGAARAGAARLGHRLIGLRAGGCDRQQAADGAGEHGATRG